MVTKVFSFEKCMTCQISTLVLTVISIPKLNIYIIFNIPLEILIL